MFNIGSAYTRDEIYSHLGGSKQSYLPTVSGHVVAACLKLNLNPRAPNVVLCGKGPVIASAGASLAKQREPLPVFIKRAPNCWEYQGTYSVTASHSFGPRFESLVATSGRNQFDISLVIELSSLGKRPNDSGQ